MTQPKGNPTGQKAAPGTSVQFVNVGKTFTSGKKKTVAVRDVNLTVNPGDILGIIGYSGAGKSTLIRLINGLDTATDGQILLDGTDIVGMPERKLRGIRRNIGMIFQQFNLLNSRTAAGNISYPLELAGMPKAERKKRVDELLDFVGLSERGGHYPSQLSGGQKQRIGIARALATNPTLLLADEATSALDPETTADVLELLRKVNEELGITIVLITHEMHVVREIADFVAVMDAGEVVESGPTHQLFRDPQHPMTQRFVKTAMQDRPGGRELDMLLDSLEPGVRLATLRIGRDTDLTEALAAARDAGVDVQIVHGSVNSVQQHSFGRITVRLLGDDTQLDQVFTALRKFTDVEELTR